MPTIDLNSDLGENVPDRIVGDDAAMLRVVTSANVACGFHAGAPSIMRGVTAHAARSGVAVGAHVSYNDPQEFGRRFIDMDPGELADEVTYQIGALDAFARLAGARVTYVKPHGGLYNAIVTHEAQAAAVVAGVTAYSSSLVLLGLPGSAVLRLAEEAGLPTAREAFADGLEILLEAGVRAVVQPGGSIRDAESVEAARRAGVTMYFTGARHFFH